MSAPRRVALVVVVTALACKGGAEEPTDNVERSREIVADQWDTVFVAGGLEETVIAEVFRLEVWGHAVVVADKVDHRIVVLDSAGKVVWSAGREGGGPGEFRGLADLEIGCDGLLYVLDQLNERLTPYTPTGDRKKAIRLHSLPVPVNNVVLFSDRDLLFTANRALASIVKVEVVDSHLRVTASRSFPWPAELSHELHLRVAIARHPSCKRKLWAAGFKYGPGFMVFRGDSASIHNYIEEIPFSYRWNPKLIRAGADSARYGAVSMSAAGNELFILTGGRPNRVAHPGEPTRVIDVYGFDGAYRRSYRLPFDAGTMATDGEVFYLGKDEPVPQVYALRPRTDP